MGTEFSGIETVSQILDRCNIQHSLEFATEKNGDLLAFIKQTFKPKKTYTDVSARKASDLSDIDFYAAGPPCQAFALGGKRDGLDDAGGRGHLLFEVCEVAEKKQPRHILIETVANLAKEFSHVFDEVLRRLRREGHRLKFGTMNTCDHGVPQSRNRIYIVAILRTFEVQEFEFPEKLSWTIPLKDIIEDHPYLSNNPLSNTNKRALKKACKEIKASLFYVESTCLRAWVTAHSPFHG